VRLAGSTAHDGVVVADDMDAAMDEDPLTYFLTPAPALEDQDDGDMEMEFGFDAGFGTGNDADEIVRSVSPSSLDGMSLPPPRPPTPPKSPPARLSPDPESATDDEDEEYIRFGIGPHHTIGLPFSLRDFASMKSRKAAKGKSSAIDITPPSSPRSSLAPTAAARGRSAALYGSSPPGSRYNSTRGRTRSASARRSPHVWREPSPDVWSIEEETEEDVSDVGSHVANEDLATKRVNNNLEVPAAKLKKRVRFVLPIKEA